MISTIYLNMCAALWSNILENNIWGFYSGVPKPFLKIQSTSREIVIWKICILSENCNFLIKKEKFFNCFDNLNFFRIWKFSVAISNIYFESYIASIENVLLYRWLVFVATFIVKILLTNISKGVYCLIYQFNRYKKNVKK